MSAFAGIESLGRRQFWPGLVGRTVEGERITLVVIELEPGAVVAEHRHENEQLGVLIEGSLRFSVGEETRSLAPGATWCIGANVPHSVVAGPDGAIAIEAFSPVRADWRALELLEPGPGRWP